MPDDIVEALNKRYYDVEGFDMDNLFFPSDTTDSIIDETENQRIQNLATAGDTGDEE